MSKTLNQRQHHHVKIEIKKVKFRIRTTDCRRDKAKMTTKENKNEKKERNK